MFSLPINQLTWVNRHQTDEAETLFQSYEIKVPIVTLKIC